VPQLREIITHLLFAPLPSAAGNEAQNGDDQRQGWQSIKPRLRYKTLSFAHKIAILAFICELSTGTKAIHGFLETCENSLTEMRKEKVELKKQHKKASDQLANMTPKKKKKANGANADGATVDGSEKSDQETEGGGDAASDEAPPSSDGGSSIVTPSGSGRPTRGPRTSLRFRAQSQSNLAKQAAEKSSPTKSPTKGNQEKIEAKIKELEEQVAKLDAQIEGLEIEFRQYAYISRMRPIGKDRFHYKVWWFDGVGALALVNAEGETQYGTGKLFIQGPGVDEQGMIAKKVEDDPSVSIRRQLEDGPSVLGLDEWGWYETPEEVCLSTVGTWTVD
jgi:bromodomain adjacent to zinc finger domain protein 1A